MKIVMQAHVNSAHKNGPSDQLLTNIHIITTEILDFRVAHIPSRFFLIRMYVNGTAHHNVKPLVGDSHNIGCRVHSSKLAVPELEHFHGRDVMRLLYKRAT